MVAATALLCALVVVVGLCVILVGQAVERNNRHWCDTLTLITSTPVPKPADPKAKPARAGQYQLYADFVKLRREFGC